MPNCSALQVIRSESLGNDQFFELILEDPGWEWTPGQFLMLRPESWQLDPFSSRPFSIADLDEQGLHLFIQAVGRGTRLLRELKPGDRVTAWGPLGRGFTFDEDTSLLLLAGGMGLAPFVGLILHHPHPVRLELLFGHRQDLSCYPFEALQHKTMAWHFQDHCPQDLLQFRKVVAQKIEDYAAEGLVLACGPLPFLRMVKELGTASQANVQLSLETEMMCGIGACLGCTDPGTGGGNLQTCIQGPVFRAEEVRLGD